MVIFIRRVVINVLLRIIIVFACVGCVVAATITAVATKARQHNITAGNTEGWGPVGWVDHPELDWNWVKEAADISVGLAKKHANYKYICSSNFTHPQFKGIWEDMKWHRKITSIIKS